MNQSEYKALKTTIISKENYIKKLEEKIKQLENKEQPLLEEKEEDEEEI